MADFDINLGVKANPDEVKKSAEELRRGIEDVFNQNAGNTEKKMLSLKNSMKGVYEESLKVSNELDAIADKKIPTNEYKDAGKDMANYAEILYNAKMEMSKLTDPEEIADFQPYVDKAQKAFDNAKQTVDDLVASGRAFTLGKDTEEYTKKAEQLEKLNNKMRVLMSTAQEYNQAQQPAGYAEWLKGYAQRLAEAQKEAQKAHVEETKRIQERSAKIKSALKNVFSGFTGGASRIVQKGLGTINAKLKETQQQAKRARSMFKSFVLAMLGVRSISAIFSKLKSAISEGFKYLEQFDGKTIKFKTDMEEFKKSTMFLKNSLAAAFAPLVTAVIPYLQAAANALGDFMQKLGAFFAMLTGQSVMVVAKKQTDEYDKALKKAGGSASKLRAELYGFDTLNKQQDNSGGGGADGANMFEEKNVSDVPGGNIKSLLDELKELWANKNYYGIGEKIAEGLNDGVVKLDKAVRNARVKLESVSKNLATGLNGLVESFNFRNFGTLLADGINTGIGTENAFLSTFHFDSLGAGIGESIDQMFQDIEWDNLGTNLALKFNALFDFVDGIVSEGNLFPNIADAVTQTIMGFADNIEPQSLGDAIVTTFNQAAEYLATVNWYDVMNIAFSWVLNIASWLVGLIEQIEWGDVGAALIRAWWDLQIWLFSPSRLVKVWAHIETWILSLLSIITNFLLGMLKGAFQGIADLFSEIGLDCIAGFFRGISDEIDVWMGAFKMWFEDMIQAVKDIFGIHSPSTVFENIGGFLIEGLKNGIINTWNKIKDGIYDTFSGFTDKVKSMFGISSPSKVFEEYGKFIDLGFAEGIEGEKSAVAQAVDDMVSSVTAQDAEITPDLNTDNLTFNLDNALTKLSLIADKFLMIGQIFNSIGNIPVPALATGGVVPPNAYGNYGQSVSNDGGLISKIQELIDRLDGGASPVEVHAHLELDGKEIYDTVVTENNNQIQRTGSSRIRV